MAKWLFGLFLLLTTIITICFLWNEIDSLSLSEKINHDKFSSYFTSVGAIGTALSIFLLYIQVKLANATIVASYEPDLRFTSKIILVKVVRAGNSNEFKAEYYDINKRSISLENQLELSNNGNNVALDISFQFKQRRILFKSTRLKFVFANLRAIDYREFIPQLHPQGVLVFPLPVAFDLIIRNAKKWFSRDAREWIDRETGNGTRMILTVFYMKLNYNDRTKRKYGKIVPIYVKIEDKKDGTLLFELSFAQA